MKHVFVLNKAQLEEARQWLAECSWRNLDDLQDLWSEYSDTQIENAIVNHYDGGVESFIADGAL